MAVLLLLPGTARAWFGDSYRTPSELSGGWATYGDCGTYWYTFGKPTNCDLWNRWAKHIPGFVWYGRGTIYMDWVYVGAYGYLGQRLRYYNVGNGLTGQYTDVNMCANSCSWARVLGGETGSLYDWNGIFIDCNESWDVGCGSPCGTRATSTREIHMWGDKWVYLNDWIVFGGFGVGANVSEVGWTPPFGESGVYVYGAIDTSHGNYFANNLYAGKVPARVSTGDCGQGNYLNFKGNASVGGVNSCDNCTAYAFAWVHTPSGSGQQWGVGSDDGVRIWQNGTLIHDNNASRGVTWDQDRFKPAGMNAGWNRVLFKVRNGNGGFGGVISFHHGGDFAQMEPSVSLQSDRYGGFSVGYEQDGWYPTVTVSSVYGTSSPANGAALYGNNTTVNVTGTSAGQTVPYWRTMQYMWGYGTTGDANGETSYADVTGTPTSTSWTDNRTGVTGHRRFHYFAVSKSGRTSGQASGQTGGWTWNATYAKYYDVYVDNVAPVAPSFSSVAAAGMNQINLAWAIPNDQGCGSIAAGSTEASNASEPVSASNNYYRRGDVGVQVYRNGSVISSWGTGTGKSDTGLTANTAYTYTLEARDNTSQSRGAWANTTGQKGTTVAWTLSVPPSTSTVTRNGSFFCEPGTAVTWTAVGGFGTGKIQKYKYAWDQNPGHSWTGSEGEWTSGTLSTTPTAGGNWFLHVKGYNGANVENGTLDYPVLVVANGTEKWIGGDGPWDTTTAGFWQDATPNAITYCNGHDVLFDDSGCGALESLPMQATASPAPAASIQSSSAGLEFTPQSGDSATPKP